MQNSQSVSQKKKKKKKKKKKVLAYVAGKIQSTPLGSKYIVFAIIPVMYVTSPISKSTAPQYNNSFIVFIWVLVLRRPTVFTHLFRFFVCPTDDMLQTLMIRIKVWAESVLFVKYRSQSIQQNMQYNQKVPFRVQNV